MGFIRAHAVKVRLDGDEIVHDHPTKAQKSAHSVEESHILVEQQQLHHSDSCSGVCTCIEANNNADNRNDTFSGGAEMVSLVKDQNASR